MGIIDSRLGTVIGYQSARSTIPDNNIMTNIAFSVGGVQIGVAECALIFLFLFVVFLLIRNMNLDQEA